MDNTFDDEYEEAPSHADSHMKIAAWLCAIESILIAKKLVGFNEFEKLKLNIQSKLEQELEARERKLGKKDLPE